MTANQANGADSEREVKISCRNIWKVYGPESDSYFEARNGDVADPAGLYERMRSESHVVAASNVTFDVRVGEIFIIMGLSGSGKSTMVRCLSRLVEPTAGEVLLDGSDLLKASDHELIDIRRHKMGMVFQNFGLLPHLTVLENVAFPLKVQGKTKSEREARARGMVELVGLEGRENAFPRQLSGGQQQRVGIARSLAVEPELWFLDEPFSALDPLIRRQMQDEFLRLQKMLHKTIVFITHDFLEALRLADRIVIMKDGRVVQLGTPADLVLRPADDYVAEFTKDVPRVRVITAGEIMEPGASSEPGGAGLDRANGVAAETTLEDLMPRMASHPEGLAIVDDDGAVIGRVTPQDIVRALAAADVAER
ncbi:MAG: betaine/proline/choline family ABC transporter ATP-binding protein [Kiloniellales bacterium]|nr:betaine/proline/choline family ABC transporter ATP-binding protein [Kiloniellales bacterium]